MDNIEQATKYDNVELTLDNELIYALNGAESWKEYSYGACSLICDSDIAERLCTPSELKRKDGGRLQPGRDKTWLEIQELALNTANKRIRNIMRYISKEVK